MAKEMAKEMDGRQSIFIASMLKMHRSFTTPEKCLEGAKRHFFSCTLIDDATSDDPQVRTVASLCSPRVLTGWGSVDALISHSSLDDEECKWFQMQQWAASFVQRHGRQPTVWYDGVCAAAEEKEMAASTESLAAFPVMVMGCRELLVLAGPTYATRLWALVEIIVFLWSGGEGKLHVLPLTRPRQPRQPRQQQESTQVSCAVDGGDEVMWYTDETALLTSLKRVNVATATCSCDEDRQRMLGAIEAAFGTLDAINRLLADTLHGQCRHAIMTCDP